MVNNMLYHKSISFHDWYPLVEIYWSVTLCDKYYVVELVLLHVSFAVGSARFGKPTNPEIRLERFGFEYSRRSI